MNYIEKSGAVLAAASKGNPATAALVVMIFALLINLVFAVTEKLIWGKTFEHIGDVLLLVFAIAYAAYAVHACAKHNTING